MLIIDDILLSPLKGLVFLGKKIDEIIQKEMSDEGKIKERLMELQLRYEMDEISEEEYDRQEEELLNLLEQIRKKTDTGDGKPKE
ncbi:MAG: gas vesicle protein GvpG [Mangrovibacterium sp.]